MYFGSNICVQFCLNIPKEASVDLIFPHIFSRVYDLQTHAIPQVEDLRKLLKYIPRMTFQLPRLLHILFSTFYACQSVLFLYLATSFAKKRAVTKHLTSKFCFVWHFLIKIQLTRFAVKCAKSQGSCKVISGLYFNYSFLTLTSSKFLMRACTNPIG